MVSFGEAIRLYYRQYFAFVGRASRAEYWWLQLYFWLIQIVLFVLIAVFSGDVETEEITTTGVVLFGVWGLFVFIHLIGFISLAVRRFHDLNQTGWLALVFIVAGIIPLIGILTSLAQAIWFIMPGTKGPNLYGPDPYGYDDHDPF